jgi:RHS repeat-associated protein
MSGVEVAAGTFHALAMFATAAPRACFHERTRAPAAGRSRRACKHADPGWNTAVSGRRYYSPSQGRFIGQDPIEEEGGLNLYGFCRNDSINRFDVLGMSDLTGVDETVILTPFVVTSTMVGLNAFNPDFRKRAT